MELPVTTASGPEAMAVEIIDGIFCRAGTYDGQIVKEVRKAYSTLPLSGAIVLDIGACFGAFAVLAARGGAARVLCFEPERSNFVCLAENTKGHPNIEIFNTCVDAEDGETKIYVAGSGKNPGSTTQQAKRGRVEQSIEKISMRRIMEEYRPTCCKLDCEGAEYRIGWPPMMGPSVADVAMELHLSTVRDGYRNAVALAAAYRDAGWACVREPKLSPSLWHTLGAGRK